MVKESALIRPVRTVLEDLLKGRRAGPDPSSTLPLIFLFLSTLTLIPLPLCLFPSALMGCSYDSWLCHLCVSFLPCRFSFLIIFSLSWPFLVQVSSWHLSCFRSKCLDLCLVLSHFPVQMPQERRSHSLAGPCSAKGWSGIGCVLSSEPFPGPTRSQD